MPASCAALPASNSSSSTTGALNRSMPAHVVTSTRSSRSVMGAARRSSPVKSPSTNGLRSLAIRLMPTRSLTALFTTPIASIWPAKVCDADVPDRSHRIDHQPANLSKIYYQQGARQPGDIISEPTGDILGICTELVHHREYPDRDTARRDLFAYIEGYYNRARIHSAIGYITPQQAEAKAA